MRRRSSILIQVIALSLALASPAAAATIWTDWTQAAAGHPGSATGTLDGITVTYSGDLHGAVTNGTSNIWLPSTTFVGGTIDTSPDVVGDDLRLVGDVTTTNTITFSDPVTNPVFAIWSLGRPGFAAAFNFQGITPTFQVGGPNSQFGGSAISVVGNTVFGSEGNGVVQFNGTFTSISWTNTPENFYAFTVGMNETRTIPSPEPATLLLFGTGVGIALRRWRPRHE